MTRMRGSRPGSFICRDSGSVVMFLVLAVQVPIVTYAEVNELLTLMLQSAGVAARSDCITARQVACSEEPCCFAIGSPPK